MVKEMIYLGNKKKLKIIMISNDNKIAAAIGLITGLVKYFTSPEGIFIEKLISVGIIAFFSAFLGVFGKNIAEHFWQKIKNYFIK